MSAQSDYPIVTSAFGIALLINDSVPSTTEEVTVLASWLATDVMRLDASGSVADCAKTIGAWSDPITTNNARSFCCIFDMKAHYNLNICLQASLSLYSYMVDLFAFFQSNDAMRHGVNHLQVMADQ